MRNIMKTLEIKVNGMVCEGCEKRVENVLKKIENVSSVIASHEKNLVTITYQEEIDENECKEKIENLGYTIED